MSVAEGVPYRCQGLENLSGQALKTRPRGRLLRLMIAFSLVLVRVSYVAINIIMVHEYESVVCFVEPLLSLVVEMRPPATGCIVAAPMIDCIRQSEVCFRAYPTRERPASCAECFSFFHESVPDRFGDKSNTLLIRRLYHTWYTSK